MSHRSGFSLAELLISFLILTVIIVTMLTMIPIVLTGINQASQRAQASDMARETLELLRVQGALSADDVLLGNASSGKGVGGLNGRLIPPGQEPQGIPDPPP